MYDTKLSGVIATIVVTSCVFDGECSEVEAQQSEVFRHSNEVLWSEHVTSIGQGSGEHARDLTGRGLRVRTPHNRRELILIRGGGKGKRELK